MPSNVIIGIVCAVSIIGAVSIILSHFILPTKGNGRALLAWLSVADLITALVYMLPIITGTNPLQHDSFCEAQALLGIFFPVASFLWTDCIAWYLYRIVVLHSEENTPYSHTNYFPLFHLICWGVPAAIVVLIAACGKAGKYQIPGKDYANTGGWCWIKYQNEQSEIILWELIGGKAIEWFSDAIFVPVIYFRIVKRLRAMSTDGIGVQEKFNTFTLRLITVPIIFFLIRLWGSVLAIQTMMNPNEGGSEWVMTLAAIFDPSQGLWNAIVFVIFASEVRVAYQRFFVTVFLKKTSETEPITSIESSDLQRILSVNQRINGYDRLLQDA